MNKLNINVARRNLNDPRYRPKVVKNTKGKGTYDRKKDKQVFQKSVGSDHSIYLLG